MGYVLITGGNGFIGKNFLSYLNEIQSPLRDKIVLLTSSSSDKKYPVIEHKNYSFSRNDFFQKGFDTIDIVLHIGAYTPKNAADAANVELNTSNIFNTLHLIENLPSIPEKIIFTSTLDIYQKTIGVISEETPEHPATIYGWSKLYCEKLLLQWCEKQNVLLQILRLGHIYGSGEENYKKLIPETIKKVLKEEAPVIYSDGNEKRSFLHVKDCARAIHNSFNLETYPGPVNIVSANAMSVKDVVNKIIEVSGKKIRPEILGQQTVTTDYIFDNSKMKKFLGDEEITFKDGIANEYDYLSQLL